MASYANLRYDRILAAHRNGDGGQFQMYGGDQGSPAAAPNSGDPVIFDAYGNVISGDKTGNTNRFATADASTKTSGNYPKWDANGNLTGGDTGGGGGGSGASISSGLTADLPAPANSGDYYGCTDGPYHYIAAGSPLEWRAWAFGKSVTEPVLADWTWVNQETADAVSTYGGIYMTTPASAGEDLRILKKAAPSTPYTMIVGIHANFYSVQYPACGVLFRQSSDGKVSVFRSYMDNTSQKINVCKMNDFNGGGEATYTDSVYYPQRLMWFKLQDTGANRVCSISFNGIDFHLIHTVGRTDFLTADEIGIYISSQNATFAMSAHFFHLAIT